MFTRVKVIGAVALAISLVATPVLAVTGSQGESLTVSQSKAIKSGSTIIVTGRHYDETVGIYVAFCKVVPKGQLPTPCGGGADKSGAAGASQWISSNPPPYGAGLAKPFLPGGRFKVAVKVASKIGTIDCKRVKCAIYTRADHTRGEDRSFDLYIPIIFK
jgi:hypothetical protein